MPQKRDVLTLLTRDELLSVVDRFELSPEDRRAKEGLIEVIAASKKATLNARVVGLDEIEKNDFNLNISRYVDTSEAAEKIDVAQALAKLRELEKKRREAEARMNAFLRELGCDA